jgi:hypothetical protein
MSMIFAEFLNRYGIVAFCESVEQGGPALQD